MSTLGFQDPIVGDKFRYVERERIWGSRDSPFVRIVMHSFAHSHLVPGASSVRL